MPTGSQGPTPETGLTSLVDGARRGDEAALAALMPVVYDELRRLAASYLRRERPGQTLQATALVHDLYLRLVKDEQLSWQNRAHFFGIAARSMRHILVERARTRSAAKRGGSRVRVTLDAGLVASESRSVDLEALDEALIRLAALDSGLAHLVDVRFFGGLSIEEAAEALGISPATVKRRWALAKAWLARELGPDGPHDRGAKDQT
jgi:RNA polymerase sigma factor (TIGR02999 family)